MKRLILDHCRRWAWLLALGAAFAFLLGWFLATPTNRLYSPPSAILRFLVVWFKVQSNMFEFSTLTLTILTGPFLLLFDWHRGVVRTVAPLPLPPSQIGRSWWLASVAIPAAGLAGFLLLGAGTYRYFYPNEVFPVQRLVPACLYALVWPAIMFAGVMLPRTGFWGHDRKRSWSSFFSLLSSIFMFVGISFHQDELQHPLKFAVFLLVAAWLAVIGWRSAGQFAPGRAAQINRGRASFRLLPPPNRHHPRGQGGIQYWVRLSFVRPFAAGLAMFILLLIFRPAAQQAIPREVSIMTIAPMGLVFAFYIVLFHQVQVALQLRFLRTLPISTNRLAVALIASAVLPLAALGTVTATIAVLAWDTVMAGRLWVAFTLNLLPVAFGVWFVLWRGAGMFGNAMAILATIVLQMVCTIGFFQRLDITPVMAGVITAIGILLAFLLLRALLQGGSRAYRIQKNPLGNAPRTLAG